MIDERDSDPNVLAVPPAGSPDALKVRDAAVMRILAFPIDDRLKAFAEVCFAYRIALRKQWPNLTRRAINLNCRNFGSAVLGRLQAIEQSNGASEGRA